MENKRLKMKGLIYTLTAVFVLCCSFTVNGQNSAIDRYYQSYADDETFTKVTISSKMFSLFTNFDMEDESEQQVVETISKLSGLKMLVANDYPQAEQTFREAIRKPLADMEELMTVKEKDQELIFFINESKGRIAELLMISYEEESLVILSLTGDIDLKEISTLSGKMDIKGFDQLEKVSD